MNIGGLWTVFFSTSHGEGAGTLTLLRGYITGGDSSYYYVGSYKQNASAVEGVLRVVHFAGPLNNLFGPIRQLDLHFNAVAGKDLMMAQAQPVGGMSAEQLSIRMQRVHNLDELI